MSTEEVTTEETQGKRQAEAPAAEEKTPKKAPAKKQAKAISREDLVEAIKGMTVLELSELVKTLEAELGVSAAAPVAAAAPAVGPAEAVPAAAEEEKTEFSVILTSFGANKINVIKAVREVSTLGLKEAKDLVESAPKPVREGVSKAEAGAIKEKLEAAGASVELR